MAFFIPGIRRLWSSHADSAEAPRASQAPSGKKRGKGTSQRNRKTEPAEGRNARTYAREAAALLLIASGLYCALALASYRADPMRPSVHGDDWVGPVGEVFARATVGLVGVVAWLIPLELALLSRPLLRDKKIQLSITRLSGDVVVVVILAALIHIALPETRAFGNMPLGGVVGDLFGEVARGLFSTVGSFLIGLTIVGLILIERATFSFIALAQRFQAWLARMRDRAGRGVGKVGQAWVEARVADRERREEERRASEPLIASAEQADAIIAAFADDGDGGLTPWVPRRPSSRNSLTPPLEVDSALPGDAPEVVDVEDVADVPTPSPIAPAEPTAELFVEPPTPSTPSAEPAVPAEPSAEHPLGLAPTEAHAEPRIVDTSEAAKTKKAKRLRQPTRGAFALPGPELLDPPIVEAGGHSPQKLKDTARLLEKTLLDYKVEGAVQEIHPGPTVTMFEVSPAAGTKVSKVAGLADDLALGLSRKVRIVAPIPGKNRIGFEVPNDKRIPVNLRELIESQDFMGLDRPLPCVLGRDIIGRPCFADLASMPHVIVAGATGAGKSVGLNVMLVSLLYRRTPEDLRLLMIDPKVVELAPFDNIPHLLFPVVTDMKQASNALKWTVDEMERRYQLFADAGTRNITTYNKWVKRVREGKATPPPPPAVVSAVTASGDQVEIPGCKDDATLPNKLPYIVIVIEEFADLMMTQGKEVEASVARLAQKARAAGLHVILATQRPSVDVITGMIKANFPTRIAFRVSQKVDSRTILDQQGAEHLLGHGDMLVKLAGTSDVRRVQCPFVSEDEVQRITDMLRAQGEPEYDETIVRSRDDDGGEADPGDAEADPLYDQGVRIVAETRKCSTSWIQRKLGIGYNRAAKIVETMEKNGVVGPPNGSKPREIYISPH